LPALNVVLDGAKDWVFISEKDFAMLPKHLQERLLSENAMLSIEFLETHGIPYRPVTVKAGQGLFVPSGVFHSVRNWDCTVAVAYNLMLPTVLPVAWDAFERNRSLGCLMGRDISKIQLHQLVARLAFHLGSNPRTPLAEEIHRTLTRNQLGDLTDVVLRLLQTLISQETPSFRRITYRQVDDKSLYRTVRLDNDSSKLKLTSFPRLRGIVHLLPISDLQSIRSHADRWVYVLPSLLRPPSRRPAVSRDHRASPSPTRRQPTFEGMAAEAFPSKALGSGS